MQHALQSIKYHSGGECVVSKTLRFYPESRQGWQVWGVGERRLVPCSHQPLEKKTVTKIKSLPSPFCSFY